LNIDLFELGNDQRQQEELSQQAVDVVKEKAFAKNVKRHRENDTSLEPARRDYHY
jgi:hypothetical protein